MTMLGFGGSGAWWLYDLCNFPKDVRANLSNLLSSDYGLGLTNYRYNFGGGGVNVSNPVRAPETFFVSNDMRTSPGATSSTRRKRLAGMT